LLQQVNLLPAASTPTPSASANHVHTSLASDSSFPTQSGISSIFTCFIASNNHDWFIDSGANEHVVSSTDWFTSFHKIKPKPVNLPNGTSVLVEYAGTIHFTSDFFSRECSLFTFLHT
jgi:hypothetical protein